MEEELTYTEKFRNCKKAWKWGAIWAVLLSAVMSLLSSNSVSTFFGLVGLFYVPSVMTMGAVCALKYTNGFGLSWMAGAFARLGSSIMGIFDGCYVTIGFLVGLIFVGTTVGFFGLMAFCMLFPLETAYYWLRYKIENKSAAANA